MAASLDPAGSETLAGVGSKPRRERVDGDRLTLARHRRWSVRRRAPPRLGGWRGGGPGGIGTARRSCLQARRPRLDPLQRYPRLELHRGSVRMRGPPLHRPASRARLDEPPRRILGVRQRGAAFPAAIERWAMTTARERRIVSPASLTGRRTATVGQQAEQDRQEGESEGEDEHSIHPRRDATRAAVRGQTCCERASPHEVSEGVQPSRGGAVTILSSSAASA